MQNLLTPRFQLGFPALHEISSDSADNSEDDAELVSSMARSTPLIQRSPLHVDVYEHSLTLVPYSQTRRRLRRSHNTHIMFQASEQRL